MIEVCVFTALLALGMHALPGLQIHGGEVNAPGAHGVRDYMLRYMGEVFVGHSLGSGAAVIAGHIISIVFGLLLLSAVNTAIVDLIAISFLMSRDGEVPAHFQKLNRFGVPAVGLIVAAAIPAVLVLVVKDMAGLAELYAVGVVGAIATNLGATSTDKGLSLARWERGLMLFTFAVMLTIEVSLLIDKPNARTFAMTILAVGLILRGLATERAQKRASATQSVDPRPMVPSSRLNLLEPSKSPIICAVRVLGKTLDFALEHAREAHRPLYVLFVREQPALTPGDHKRKWQEDEEANCIFKYAAQKADGLRVLPCYAVSDSAATTIADVAATVGASELVLGAPTRSALVSFLRGNIVRHVADILPDDIQLLVAA
jgi:nucleotide-binding universal stress UspA family protein